MGGASVGGDDGGDAAGEGFEDYVAEGVGVGGEDQEIHVRVGGGERFVAENAGDVGVRQRRAESCFFASLADDDPARRDTEGAELGVDFGEERYIFFHGQATYVAQYWLAELGVVERAGAPGRREEVRVDAALHEVAGSVGSALEERAEGGIGGVEGRCPVVEMRGDLERGGFDNTLKVGTGVTEVLREPTHPTGCVLVQIGVPAGDERHVELVGEVGSKEAEFAGAGDVDDVGAKGSNGGGDEVGVAKKEWVEAEIFFEMHGEWAAA